VREHHHLLLRALVQPISSAAEAWRLWREGVDLDKLDAASFCMLPALAGRMDQWVAHDPHRDMLRGICRRAWSQNQVRKKVLAEALTLLDVSAGVKATAFGPIVWEQLYWPDGAIRTIDGVELLVDPSCVRLSVETLTRAGWSLNSPLPDWHADSFYFAPALRMRTISGDDVRLHWRDLPNTDFALRRPPVPRFQPSAERDLIMALSDDLHSGVDWRCDALLICRRSIDWGVVDRLLKWRPRVKIRLEELRQDWDVDVPPRLAAKLQRGHVEYMFSAPLRVYRRARARARQRYT
jgi:hypothetical protein